VKYDTLALILFGALCWGLLILSGLDHERRLHMLEKAVVVDATGKWFGLGRYASP
jgi:hypothetical protein